MTRALYALIVFAVLLAVYALVLWATGDRQPSDKLPFWDDGEDK